MSKAPKKFLSKVEQDAARRALREALVRTKATLEARGHKVDPRMRKAGFQLQPMTIEQNITMEEVERAVKSCFEKCVATRMEPDQLEGFNKVVAPNLSAKRVRDIVTAIGGFQSLQHTDGTEYYVLSLGKRVFDEIIYCLQEFAIILDDEEERMQHQLESFKKAADAFDAKHGASPEAAKRQLVKEGILTEDGELTENYRSEDQQ